MGITECLWSSYQQAIFKAVAEQDNSLIIEAVAGSGKTTTIVEAINHVPQSQSVAFLAFNRSIAEELKRRITAPNAKCMTLHAAGFSAWRRYLAWDAGNLQVNSKKCSQIASEIAKERGEWKKLGSTVRLVSIAKNSAMVPSGLEGEWASLEADDDQGMWSDLIDFYGFDPEECDVDLAREVLRQSIIKSREEIDYDDMLYMPIVTGAAFDKYDVIFLDEAQDVSEIQVEMVSRMRGSHDRVIAVGDSHQCQPAGTLVRTPDGGNVRIETLKDGDKVVAVDIAHSCFKAAGEPIKVSERNYLGPLVEVYSEGRKSAYTPNHKCIANPKPLCSKYVVYLMQRGQNWRIGYTQFGVVAGSGIRTRLMTEKADALWVLSVHESSAEARFQEAMMAATHGIPERTFVSQSKNGKGLDQELLDRFWNCIPHQGAKALNVLTLFNRQLEFPLVSKKTVRNFAVRRPSKIQACNLLPGMLVLHDQPTIHYKKHQWKKIDQVLRYNYDGKVYSLDVAGAHTYIADGIATHNSIYGFRGALCDSMKQIRDRFDCEALPLSVSYRCPQEVVKHVQQWVPHIEWFAEAITGLVHTHAAEYLDEKSDVWNLKDFAPGDAILCRNARPVVAMAFELIRNKIPAYVIGRDIGQGLVKLVEKMKALDMEDLIKKFDKYRQREIAKARGDEGKIASICDKLDTLDVFISEVPPDGTVADLITSINKLFGEGTSSQSVVLSTVHKSKGLEWDRVFILDADLYMPSRWAVQPWQRQQETNLCYVAATRTKGELRYISSEGLR